MSGPVRVRRVHEPADPDGDGARVLVDRVWPRGLSKDRAALHTWLRDVAPSTELRRWYAHDPARFEGFARRYREELDTPERRAALDELRALAAKGPLTLLTATKDVEHSQAAVLTRLLKDEAGA